MEKIYISPFSIKAVGLYHRLKKEGANVEGFMDSNPYLWNKTYDEVGIYQRCYIHNAKVIICAESVKVLNNIKDDLMRIGYDESAIHENSNEKIEEIAEEVIINDLQNVYPKSNMEIMEKIEDIKKLKKMKSIGIQPENIPKDELFGLKRREIFEGKIFLKQFEVIVTNKCSLKCKKCAAGIQYFQNPLNLEAKEIIKDYGRMLELIDWVDRVVVMGGEPFLYENLDDVLEGIYQNTKTKEKVGAIKIITNGTIVPKDTTLKTMSKYGTIVWISNYGKQSRNISELIRCLRKNKIDYSVMPILEWSDVIQLNKVMTVQTEEVLKYRRKNDCVTRCRTIANGRFYLCSLLKTMDCLKINPFSITDYIDLYDESAREKMRDMLDLDKPLPQACSFCTGCSEAKWNEGGIKAAEQSLQPVPYIRNRS